ncbi:hypothetical protein BVX99_01630, partial [bacterium F16]
YLDNVIAAGEAGELSAFMNEESLYSAYGEVNLKLNRLDLAANAYRTLYHYPSRRFEATMNLGVIFFKRKQWQKAKQCFEKSLHMKPDDALLKENIRVVDAEIERSKNVRKPVSDRPHDMEAVR